jgi:phosphatidylserine/phosphatidylglycerophosphate/cardiolipin synthase-like enzyme
MLANATTCILFIGWFGTECIPKLKELKDAGLTIKAITHKPGERKGPAPEEIQKGYAELATLLGLDNLSVNPLVHGRAIVVDNKALAGSMDLNAFSLRGEHAEFAVYTEDPFTVRSLKAYFDKVFKPLNEASS